MSNQIVGGQEQFSIPIWISDADKSSLTLARFQQGSSVVAEVATLRGLARTLASPATPLKMQQLHSRHKLHILRRGNERGYSLCSLQLRPDTGSMVAKRRKARHIRVEPLR